ncbi:hypothetical protein ACEPPN_015026 [Leptodophora sp. 'Broadleaf-Isolate-01']
MSSRRESEFARLEQLLQEADERAEQERRRAEDERKRAEDEQRNRKEADERAEQERRRAEDAEARAQIEEEKTKPTTFEEYLRACHTFLSKPLHIQTDKSLSTGQDLCDRPLASEKDLETYQRLAVERPTTNIISHLQRIEEARRAFNLSEGIIFENHVNTLSDNSEEICVYKEADGTRSLCTVVEYNPSHKLSVFNLRAGLLRADSGSINVPEDVINRITIPTDLEEQFVYHSEWLTTAAVTQIYGYMIENGLEYSKLATGEADVFFQVKEDEPHTLYYHLAEPSIEAEV